VAGFTLAEVLVVLIVIGLAAALVYARFDSDPRAELESEGRRLGLLLVRDVLVRCRRLLVTRPADAALADLDAALADRAKIRLAGGEPKAVADAVYEAVAVRPSA